MSAQVLSTGNTSRVMDASRRDLSKVSQISAISGGRMNIAAVNLDGNNLSTLHGIKHFPALIQLSVSDNSLVRMEEVSALCNLVSLNLQHNSLSEISGLDRLVHLESLSLAGNSIKVMDGLTANVKISHLDMSDNCIGAIGDLSMLHQLKTLLLHGNAIISLDGVGEKLPRSLSTLSLAENEVADLNEVFFLSVLPSLCQLSIMSNPCVSLADSTVFDYRPLVCYWCPGLKTLDGFPVTGTERNCSATLFPSNKPCPFTVGQHRELVHYLCTASPLHATQMLTGKSSGGNANTTSVLALEDVIKSYEQQSTDPKHSDIIEKLRALQLVEQMIKSQEHILLTQQHNGTVNTEINNPATSEDQVVVSTSTASDRYLSSPPRPVLNAWAETSPRKSQSPPLARPERPLVTSTDQSTNSSMPSMSGPATDRKTEQLKLLNAKLAQRHYKVVQMSAKSSGNSKGCGSSAGKKTTSHLSAQKAKAKQSGSTKPVTKTTHRTHQKPKEVSSKSIDTTNAPTEHKKSLNKRTIFTKSSTPLTEPSTSTQSQQLPLPPTPSKSEPSFSSAHHPSNLSHTPPTSCDPDLLSSTSYYVPLSEDPLQEIALDSQFEAALKQEESMLDSTTLATSITQAYGLSSTAESSLVLSNLWGGSADQPGSIQAGREREGTLKSVPPSQVQDMGMGPELNGNRLEEFVAQNSVQLQGCRQELAHQSQLLQLQEEILQSLLVEVESLREWKSARQRQERERAAVVIQKYWRGHKTRKTHSVTAASLPSRHTAWALCLSLQKQVVELKSVVLALTERVSGAKKVRFEEDPPDAENHPPPTELKMSHYSISCILLKWLPAVSVSGEGQSALKCYRVYVNGEVEGMVGPEKCKAYIEGLDRGTTYRITVRAVYNTGESVDSNPVVASLNPTKPTTEGSQTDQSPDHSSDEEGDKKASHLNSPPAVTMGEFSTSQGTLSGQQDSNQNTRETSNQMQDDQDQFEETEGRHAIGGDQPLEQELLTDREALADHMPVIQQDITSQQEGIGQPAVMIESLSHQQESLPNEKLPDSPQFHFQKATHITIDTVSVLSGHTIEYSPPPLPGTSMSADTILGGSSLELDREQSPSASDTSTISEVTDDAQLKPSAPSALSELASGGESHTAFTTEHTKEGVTDTPPSGPSSIPNGTVSFNHSGPQFIQSLHTSVPHSTVAYTPVSKNYLGVVPVMSHGMVQEGDGLLSLSAQRELTLGTRPHVDSLPLQNGNNTGHVPVNTLDVRTDKTTELFVNNGSVQSDTGIPYSMRTSVIAPRVHSGLSGVVVSSVTLPDTPEATPMASSQTPSDIPEVSVNRNYHEDFRAIDREDGELVSNISDHATVIEVGGSGSGDSAEKERVVSDSHETLRRESTPNILPRSQPSEMFDSPTSGWSPPEQESSSSSTSVELASQLLLELEKDISQSN